MKWIIIIAMAILFDSCTQKNIKEEKVLAALDESITMQNKTIGRYSEFLIDEMQKKIYEPISAYKAGIWLPKEYIVDSIAKKMISYLENIKSGVMNEANKNVQFPGKKKLMNWLIK